jgi:hypothetical protein
MQRMCYSVVSPHRPVGSQERVLPSKEAALFFALLLIPLALLLIQSV